MQKAGGIFHALVFVNICNDNITEKFVKKSYYNKREVHHNY